MNERIKELAEQAGFTEGGYESDEGPWIGPEFNKEKFAQLIVKECVNAVNNRGGMCGALASNWIKEHFGVEE